MGRVRLTETAKADLQDAIEHWNRTTKGQFTARNVGLVLQDLKKLAETPILDRQDIQLQGLYWYYAKDTDFKIYYKRLGPKTITVFRIWPSKREPLKPSDILN